MKVLLDTNIVVSAIAWGGKPGQLISAAVQELITLYTSPRLIAELSEVVQRIVPNDLDDDHVIAAALTANANLIVSGDQHLLDLPPSERFNILNPAKACVMVFNL
jgi:uncharacterized protein